MRYGLCVGSSNIKQAVRRFRCYQDGFNQRSCCQSITKEFESTYLTGFATSNSATRTQIQQLTSDSISIIDVEVPSNFDISEAVLPENVSPSYYTKSDKLIISDGRNLVYFPTDDDDLKAKFAELNIRRLDAFGAEATEDVKIIRRLVERSSCNEYPKSYREETETWHLLVG